MSDEDEPAPSPSATVVARRASREAKSMREESGCDEDTSSDDEWDSVQEQDKGNRGMEGGGEVCGQSKSVGKLAIRAVSRPPRKRGLFRLYAFLRCREESVHLVIAIILCDPVCAPPAVRKTFQTTGKNKNKNTSDRGTTRGSTAPRPDMPPP